MNQGIEYSIAAMVPAMRQSTLCSSLCTITVPPDHVLTPDQSFGPSGAPLASVAYIALAGHIDIPCSAATGFALTPPASDEEKTRAQILAMGQIPVALQGYYPAIIPDYRAVIDGVEYDIISAGSDSQHRQTHLVVQEASV